MSNEPNYKVLDASDKSILQLPDGALKVYLCYLLSANEMGESYLSVRTIASLTGQDTKTVIKWLKYLLECGRLTNTGDTAADRYSKPTRGSYKVRVLSVGNFPTSETPANLVKNSVGESPTPKNSHKGLLVIGYGSSSPSPSPLLFESENNCSSPSTYVPSVLEKQKPDEREEKPQPENQKPKPAHGPKCAPDGTPYPDGFDAWTNAKRLEWLVARGLPTATNGSARAGEEEKPKTRSMTKAQAAAAKRLSEAQSMEVLHAGLGNELDGDPELGPCDNVDRCHNWASRYDGKQRLCEDCFAKSVAPARPNRDEPDPNQATARITLPELDCESGIYTFHDDETVMHEGRRICLGCLKAIREKHKAQEA
jgi:Helix-turn-helix domain